MGDFLNKVIGAYGEYGGSAAGDAVVLSDPALEAANAGYNAAGAENFAQCFAAGPGAFTDTGLGDWGKLPCGVGVVASTLATRGAPEAVQDLIGAVRLGRSLLGKKAPVKTTGCTSCGPNEKPQTAENAPTSNPEQLGEPTPDAASADAGSIPVYGTDGNGQSFVQDQISPSQGFVRFEENNLTTPMQPHESPWFTSGSARQFGLSGDHDALFMYRSEEWEGLQKDPIWGAPSDTGSWRGSTASDLLRDYPDGRFLMDRGADGAVIFVRPRPPAP